MIFFEADFNYTGKDTLRIKQMYLGRPKCEMSVIIAYHIYSKYR